MEARPQAMRDDMDLDGNPFSDILNEPWIDDSSIELEQSALVEAWLDRLLSKILSTATSQSAPMFGESGLKRTGLDRKKLTEIGLEPAEIDSLYRCLYLYSVGMYRLLVDMELDQETEEKVMAAFKLLTSYLPKLGIEASMSNASYQPKTKLEVSYKQLANKIEMERLAWKEEKEDLDAEIEAQRFHASQKKQDYLDSQEILKRREQELEKCRKDLKDARAANDSLKAVMIRHEEELMRLHEECPDDVKELVRLREENEKAAKRLADTERKLRITADELEDAAFNTAALNKVREANDKFAARLAVLEKDLSSRNKELASTKEQIEKIDKENYALNELYHEEATRCAALRLRLQELAEDKEMGQRSNLQAKLLSDIEVLQARVQQLLVENEKFRSQGSNPTELEGG